MRRKYSGSSTVGMQNESVTSPREVHDSDVQKTFEVARSINVCLAV